MNTATEELQLAPVQPDEPPMKQLAPFDSFKTEIEKLKLTAETLSVTDINDKAGMKLARATRLEFREVRIAIDKRRKELGEHHLRETQRINADAKELRELIEPLEERLQLQEDFIERETARIADEKRAARSAELAPFLSGPVSVDLGVMTDEAYAGLLSDSKGLHAAKIERERKEQEEAAAKLKAEAEERERIRLENEQMKKEAAEREAAAQKDREDAAAKLKAEQDKALAEREAAQAKADAEAKKIREEAAERERIAAEKAKKEREAIEAEAKSEREAREKIESELAAKKEAEDKAEADRLAAQEAAELAPEKEKLKALAKTIRELHVPVLKTDKGIAAVVEIAAKVEAFAGWVSKKAEAL